MRATAKDKLYYRSELSDNLPSILFDLGTLWYDTSPLLLLSAENKACRDTLACYCEKNIACQSRMIKKKHLK